MGHLESALGDVEQPSEFASVSSASLSADYRQLTLHREPGCVSKSGIENPPIEYLIFLKFWSRRGDSNPNPNLGKTHLSILSWGSNLPSGMSVRFAR
jgi:hypothetical protein